MTSSRIIPKLHKYIGGRVTAGCAGGKAGLVAHTSDNWLLSELLFGLFGLALGGECPVFIVKSFGPDK